MKCVIPEISWHNREPVLCIDVHPENEEFQYKIATGGADNHILIWLGTVDEKGGIGIEVASDLIRHQRAVNAVRWSPDGSLLASADDDAVIFIWSRKAQFDKEQYVVQKILRGHKDDVYDLCWSPNGEKIISGSIDNTAIIWDVVKGKSDHIFTEHKGFVQGVSWDPKGQYVATLSSDRQCRLIDSTTKTVKMRMSKGLVPVPENHPFFNKVLKYFHDDTFKSYFRRFGFSPDGNLILTPSGLIETDDGHNLKCAYLFTLNNTEPVGIFPFANSCTLVAKFSPMLYELSPGFEPYIDLQYRMVFAIATETDILLYDTQQSWPFARLKNVHYTRITDLSWSSDGRLLVASSSDGYCTLLSLASGEIGKVYVRDEVEEVTENGDLKEAHDESDGTSSNKATFLLQWANKVREGIKPIKQMANLSIAKGSGDFKNANKEEVNLIPVKRIKNPPELNTLMKFLNPSPEKKVKSSDDSDWKSPSSKINLTNDDTTVPDLNLKIEDSMEPIVILSDDSNDTTMPTMTTKTISSEKKDNSKPVTKAPRRVPLVTLSTPKKKKAD